MLKRKNYVLWLALPVLLVLVLIGVLLFRKPASDAASLTAFNEQVVVKVLENYWDGDFITDDDIAIDQIYYGSFSQENAKEVLVLCKILNQPHVGGLDKTVGLVLEQDSLEVVAYEEFPADKVEIGCFQTKSGKSRVLFIGTSTYQGISGQAALLFDIQGSQWVQVPIDALDGFEGEYFCFMGEDMLVVSSTAQLTSPARVMGILVWDAEAEQFVLAQ